MVRRWQVLRWELRSVRVRVLATVLAFLASGLLVTGSATLAIDLSNLNSRVSEDLLLQSRRFNELVARDAPLSGPSPSLESLFTRFLQNAAPGRYEAVMATVNGGITILPSGEPPSGFNIERVLVTARTEQFRDRTVLHDMNLEGRTIRLAITPVSLGDGASSGLLVAAHDIGRQREQMVASFGNFGMASAATLLLAGGLGLAVTRRLFVPIRRLRQATGSITFEDLGNRVPVPPGDDDVTQLAIDFNRMLDRLEAGITQQRQFVDDASHELRTPLTIIGGHLELLNTADPVDVRETQILLLEELDRMQSLVDELLLLARSGRPGFVRLDWIEIDAFLQAAMDRVKVLADRRWQIDGLPGAWIRADRNRLTQAVEQLALNAVHATGPGDVISLGAAWTEEASGAEPDGRRLRTTEWIDIWVADSGCGISPADQKRIFDRFARVGVSRGKEGSGLGLPIVKAIAEAHDGTFRVSSEPNVGSTFVLGLPGGITWRGY